MPVRTERADDAAAIRQVHEEAFAPSRYEADLVDALRGSTAWRPELSLVAVIGSELVGHVLLSEVTLDGGTAALALAPVGVLPARQDGGIGTALIRAGLDRASRTAYPLVVVLGHAGYYPRFGFQPAAQYGVLAPFDVTPESWLVHRLPRYHDQARGKVHYPAEWGL